jgi:hypothetical protein
VRHYDTQHAAVKEMRGGISEGRYKPCVHLYTSRDQWAGGFIVGCNESSLEQPQPMGMPMPSGMRPITQARCPPDCTLFKPKGDTSPNEQRNPVRYLPTPRSIETQRTAGETEMANNDAPRQYHLFLSHASEDKAAIADPLYHTLTAEGLRVWYDKAVLTAGDSLRRKIDEGLSVSRYGVVILSPSFFAKGWPKRELDGLVTRELDEDRKVIIPVWHNVARPEVIQFSPPLADKLALLSADGVDSVARGVLKAIGVSDASSSPLGWPLILDAWHRFETVSMAEVVAAGRHSWYLPAPQMPVLFQMLREAGLVDAIDAAALTALRNERNDVNERKRSLTAPEVTRHCESVREFTRMIERRAHPRNLPHRAPGPSGLSDEWKEAARLAHFRGQTVWCPRDEAIMVAQETSGFGRSGGVFLRCEACGLEVNIESRPI